MNATVQPLAGKPLRASNLRARVLSSLILAPLVFACIAAGGWVYTAAVTFVMALAMLEWLRMAHPDASRAISCASFFGLMCTLGLGVWLSSGAGAMAGLIATLVLFFLAARENVDRAGWVTAGLPYLGGSGLALIEVRTALDAAAGLELTLFLILVVWATDIGAYAARRLLGGPKLIPEISPNKTWAGFYGGIALASLAGYALPAGFGAKHPLVAFGLAAALSVVAQLGDLFESYVKRRSGVKDSGSIIPGHGGMLDRIDGLLFAAVFLVLFHITTSSFLRWWS